MSEVLSFEQKIQGLVDYYHALEEMDPKNPDHNEIANPDVFYHAEGHHVSAPLAEARRGVLFDMACHARIEYSQYENGVARGYSVKDLREDTDELRERRADVLAVMTAPIKPEVRQERAERIAGILADISNGKTVRLIPYDRAMRRHEAPQEITFDITRAMFGVFTNGHISDRVLTVQYDTPVYFAHTPDTQVGERAMQIDVPEIFKVGTLLETVATA